MRQIVLTRPAGRNDALARAVTAALADMPGDRGRPELVPLPLLRIDPASPEEQRAVAVVAAGLTEADWLIFVSPRAVQFADSIRPLADWAAGRVLAVGAASAEALRKAGKTEVEVPLGSQDSEGVLATLATDKQSLAGRRVWIIRGSHGREKLAHELVAAGARAKFLPVYRRSCADWPVAVPPLGQETTWIVTSPEALRCLRASRAFAGHASGEQGLLNSGLVLINRRAETVARQLGFTGPVVCAGAPDDDALAAATRRLLERHEDT